MQFICGDWTLEMWLVLYNLILILIATVASRYCIGQHKSWYFILKFRRFLYSVAFHIYCIYCTHVKIVLCELLLKYSIFSQVSAVWFLDSFCFWHLFICLFMLYTLNILCFIGHSPTDGHCVCSFLLSFYTSFIFIFIFWYKQCCNEHIGGSL